MLEVGDIARFPKVGDYSSYCRCVESKRISNGKKKAKTTRKMATNIWPGLMWRRPNFARRYCVKAQSFYQSKEAKTKPVVAIKALSNKLSKASYYIMRDQVAFDEEKLFG